MNENSVIIGWGTVGKAIAEALGIKKYFSRKEFNITLEQAAKKKYIHICLPTPTIDGECYVDGITGTIKKLLEFNPNNEDCVFIIHSTVYAGYNKYLQKRFKIKNIVSNPEFLSEDTAVEDTKQPLIIVIGADEPRYREMVYGIYSARFKYVQPIMTDSTTAELVKLSLNAFFSTKVVFANQIYDYAQEVHANYEVIKMALLNHPWGSKNHFTIHHKGGRGAGGKCLPKDLEAFATANGNTFFLTLDEINKQILKESNKQ